MLLGLVGLWVSAAVMLWGGVLMRVGWGSHSLTRSRFQPNRHVGDPRLAPIFLGLAFIVQAFAFLVVALGLSAGRITSETILFSILFVFGLVLSLGHARFESDLRLTMMKNPKSDTGLISRVVGALIGAIALALLLSSLEVLDWTLSAAQIGAAISVTASLFAAFLVNIITANVGPGRTLPGWIPGAAGAVAFALILTQTAWWPPRAKSPFAPVPISEGTVVPTTSTRVSGTVGPNAPEIEGLIPAKRILRIGDETKISVKAVDREGQALTYLWSAVNGTVTPEGWTNRSTIAYVAPDFTTVDTVQVTVRDEDGKTRTTSVTIQVVR